MKNIFYKNYFFVMAAIAVIACNLITPQITMAAEKAYLKNIIITNNRDYLISYFDVKQAFTEDMKQAVLNGVPTTFSFLISIYRPRGVWFDKKISGKEITSTLKYNSLKEEFTVDRPWSTSQTSVTKSFDQAKIKMTEIDNLQVVPLASLKKGEKYQLRIKAELDRVTLPLYLHYVFFFVSWWDFETDWHTIDFIY